MNISLIDLFTEKMNDEMKYSIDLFFSLGNLMYAFMRRDIRYIYIRYLFSHNFISLYIYYYHSFFVLLFYIY